MNNVVLVSDILQSDSVVHIHVSILSQILSPFRLLHNIEWNILICSIVSVGDYHHIWGLRFQHMNLGGSYVVSSYFGIKVSTYESRGDRKFQIIMRGLKNLVFSHYLAHFICQYIDF